MSNLFSIAGDVWEAQRERLGSCPLTARHLAAAHLAGHIQVGRRKG